MKNPPKQSPIAVVGAAAIFPGSIDKDGFWRDILAGRDLITDVPATHWLIDDYYDPDPRARDKTYARRGAFLPAVDFDPVAWGVPPSIVPATDTTQLLALIVAQQVLEDAWGSRFKDMPRDRVSVILGVTSAQELLGSMVSRLQRPVWRKALREMGLAEAAVVEACDRIAGHYTEWQESTFPGVLGNVVAGRIANRLDLGGTNCITDAACASSFSALAMAVAELRLGQSDLVIAGGADTMNDIFMYVCFSKTPALSPTGDCRPFSDRADGTLLGEGIGMVALKRLEDAERDGDRIYAVITGVGSSSDGRSKSVYAPVARGQSAALRRAYEQAGYQPDTVELVEAHGTGTKAGDAAEFEALRTVFDETGRADRGWCALGSVKSQVGHTKAAAGVAGLFKAVMALHHKVLPPTIKVDRPDPKLAIDSSPFHLNTQARPWIRDDRYPRRASVSSFGFGGSNFHVALEEYTGPAARPARVRPAGGEVVLVGGASAAAVAASCRELARDAATPGMLAYLARTTQESFDAGAPARLSVFAESDADLAAKLEQAADLVADGRDFSMPGGIDFAVGPRAGEIGFLFPGQGSQVLGMGGDLAMALDVARDVWDRAARLPIFDGGARLHDVVFPRPAFDDDGRKAQVAQLTATSWAQPGLGTASLALLEILRELGVKPAAVGGHSFGEVVALGAAGVLSADDVLRVARRRGELMASAARVPGAMTSVVAAQQDVRPLLDAWDLGLVIANHNSPNQLVLSGPTAAVAEAERRLGEAGFATTRLDVATAFHSPLVSPACEPLRGFLQGTTFGAPTIDVYAGATAAAYPSEAGAMRDLLARQVAEPVRFVELVEAMYARGVRIFVEVGPGRVLTNLCGHILKQRPHRAIALDRKGRPGLASLHQGLGQLSVAGVGLAYERLWRGFAPAVDPRKAHKPAMIMKVNGASYGKIYPPPGGSAALPRPNLSAAELNVPSAMAATPMSISTPAPTVAAAPVAARTGDREVQLAWVQAFQDSQRQTAEAHAAFQRSMAETHGAFLRSADASLSALAAMLGVAPAAPAPTAGTSPLAPQTLMPPVADAPIFVPVPASPPAPAPVTILPPAPVAVQAAVPVAVAAPALAAAPPVASAGSALTVAELQEIMIDVVAAQTGYPREMLGVDMDLEADLGVDSIKRVEILVALTARAPGLPEVSAGKVAGKRTLREIAAFFDQERGARGSQVAAPTDTAPTVVAPIATPAASAAVFAPTPSASATLDRFAPVAVPTPALGLGSPGLLGARHLVIGNDGAGVAPALAARLVALGIAASVVEEVSADADAVILLGGLQRETDFAPARRANHAAFRAARAVAPRFTERGGLFVVVQDTGGDFGLSGSERAWLAGAPALIKTAGLEWPLAHVQALDVECNGRSADAIAAVIAHELLAGGGDQEVGLRADGTRLTIGTRAASLADGPPARPVHIGADAFVVASGGARGVTAASVIALARSARCRFLLLGRTAPADEPEVCRGVEDDATLKRVLLDEARARQESPSPTELGQRVAAVRAGREVRRTIDAVRSAGGDARYAAVDVSDGAQVAAAVAAARADWGAVTGVIHGAGVLADKLIADKTDDQWRRVFDTKVGGLRALLDATSGDELAFLLLFSSVAARSGNHGQSDYAMANEVLNKVAALEQRRRGAGCVVRSLGFGPWDGGMVNDGLRARFAELGVSLIPLSASDHLLQDELGAGAGAAEVVLGGASSGGRLHDHAASRQIVREVLVDRARAPFLDGHRVHGVPVVPVALVLEWFARAARACRPDLIVTSFRGLAVLRGIPPWQLRWRR